MNNKQQLAMALEGESKVDLFQRKEIRKTFYEKEWWFSVKDVLEALADVSDGTKYVDQLRSRDPGLSKRYTEITRTLNFQTNSGVQKMSFINIEGTFRLMQSVPSNKSESFKKWLARVGFERVQELHDPEIAIKRAIAIYRAKGYHDDWIGARIQNKASREQLVGEWEKRGIEGPQYAFLTDAISVNTFGIHTAEHKEIKKLKNSHNLRDNMTPIELTLTTLGEQATRAIAQAKDSRGYDENLSAARSGGQIAGNAKRQIEKATNKPVLSNQNYLTDAQRKNANSPAELNQILNRLLDVGPSKE